MKYIEFNENELPNIQKIGEQLFNDDKDPRSITYVRILKRPKINWWLIIITMLLSVAIPAFIGIGLYYYTFSIALSIWCPIICWLIFVAVISKKIAICLIHIYQRYAPDRIRNKCRFEPSCSEYAELAIIKFGLIKGLIKIVKRLKKCNVNGGGIDYP